MDRADVKKYILPLLSKAVFPSEEHAMFKDNFATGNGKL